MNNSTTPATAESGFVLSFPPTENAFTSDLAFQRILSSYFPPARYDALKTSLVSLADEARSPTINAFVSDAETNQPYVKPYDNWGKRREIDRLVTSQGWKELGKWGAARGIVATGYESEFGEFRRIAQFAKMHIYGPQSGLYSCPFAMTDGAARLMAVQKANLPQSHPFREVYERLTAREDFWTSGQWMTERPGGSDVQNSETWAKYAPLAKKSGEYGKIDEGDYLISGFKFFSSATDANVAMLLAKTDSGKLSVFMAPLTKTVTDDKGVERQVTNGVRIHRLKVKLGTKQLPTAELELKDVRAHLVGQLDRGVATISVLLNITRVHTFSGTLGGLTRCLSIAKSFARARTTRGQPLCLLPLHLRTLADVELKRRGLLHLSQLTIGLLGFTESRFPDLLPPGLSCMPAAGIEAEVVLRALTATTKAVCSKVAIGAVQECMEAMGGVGYMDDPDDTESNIARAYRDLTVNAIWEGTTNVLSSELLRFILAGSNLTILSSWLSRSIGKIQDDEHKTVLRATWQKLYSRIQAAQSDIPEALGDGRRVMFTLAWIICGLLLVADAQRDGDALAMEAARRWVMDCEGGVGEWVYHDIVQKQPDQSSSKCGEHSVWDRRLVYGDELIVAASSNL